MLNIRLVLLFIYIHLSAVVSNAQSDWTLIKQDNDIQIYSRLNQSMDLREIKVKTTINASVQTFISFIQDVGRFPEWIYQCSETRIVQKISELELVYYSITDAPWPVMDRDVAVHRKIEMDSISGIVNITTIKNDTVLPVYEDYVRIDSLFSQWILKPLNDHQIDVEYHVTIDPGGSIPSWLVNYTLHFGPYYTMLNLMHEIDRYE